MIFADVRLRVMARSTMISAYLVILSNWNFNESIYYYGSLGETHNTLNQQAATKYMKFSCIRYACTYSYHFSWKQTSEAHCIYYRMFLIDYNQSILMIPKLPSVLPLFVRNLLCCPIKLIFDRRVTGTRQHDSTSQESAWLLLNLQNNICTVNFRGDNW